MVVDEDVMQEMEQQEAPRTPKRTAAAASTSQGEPTSPPKVQRQVEPPGPSNSDLLLFMQQMRASQETQMTRLCERMDHTEARMCSMEEDTKNRLSAMESKLETFELNDPSADVVARDKITKLENTMPE